MHECSLKRTILAGTSATSLSCSLNQTGANLNARKICTGRMVQQTLKGIYDYVKIKIIF